MTITAEDIERDAARLAALTEDQERIFIDRQPKSRELLTTAKNSLAGGVTSSWQIARPQAVWISHGAGSKVWDVDGNEYVDMHGGYGAMAVGHAHPAIVDAVTQRISRGTHFAQPTPDVIDVAEELSRRFRQPLWRFGNSGTEATMDAVHLMRAKTGRDIIIKLEGSYHGHHDSVQVSVANEEGDIGPADAPASPASSTGIPAALTSLTRIVAYNDLPMLARLLDELDGQVAGMILEPAMMNAGIIRPEPGYLQGIKDLLHAHGALLTFDEVKTGVTAAPGGATELYGVTPDIVCLAKSIGGGLPLSALGGSADAMEPIVTGEYQQVGTFNGNPLSLAAGKAALTQVLTPEAYARFDQLRQRLVDGLESVIAEYDLPAHVVAVGSKGCVTFSRTPVRNYRDYLAIDDTYSHCHWLFQHNGGVFLPPWGKSEQWLLSAQHTMDDADLFVSNFATFARAVRG